MKKLFCTLLTGLALTGCTVSTPSSKLIESENVGHFHTYIGESKRCLGDWTAVPFEYNSHSWILFRTESHKCIVHDPDCPCQSKSVVESEPLSTYSSSLFDF